MIELQAPSVKVHHEQPAVKPLETSSKTTVAKVTLTSQQFEMLYGPDKCVSSVQYPALPPMGTSSNMYDGNMLEHQPPPYVAHDEEEDDVDAENTPFLAPTVSRIPDQARGDIQLVSSWHAAVSF